MHPSPFKEEATRAIKFMSDEMPPIRHSDLKSKIASLFWAIFLKLLGFAIYVRIKIHGSFQNIYKKHPKLLIISNHSSHLDASSIEAAVPWKYWKHLYISVAKDYWFSSKLMSLFSKYCLGAIPIDRKETKLTAFHNIRTLFVSLDRMWMIMFPEGTRSSDGYIHHFKRGLSLLSEGSQIPILFLYIEGGAKLWPKGVVLPRPGRLNMYIGPVIPPTGDTKAIQSLYKKWVETINPRAYEK